MDREKVKTGIFEMLQRDTWKDIDKERDRFQPVLNNALSLLKEQEEKLKFLDALFNYINPNDMEKYMRMYRSLPVPSNGRSVK